MRIYTKNGDAGDTDLYGGRRVRKSVETIEVLGQLDELNAFLGLTRLFLRKSDTQNICQIQNDLFILGSLVAGAKIKPENSAPLTKRLLWMEKEIDALSSKLPPLRNFILPNGCESSARLHLARAISRRCERSLVALNKHLEYIPYLNRLSDYLFTLARYENVRKGIKEELVISSLQ